MVYHSRLWMLEDDRERHHQAVSLPQKEPQENPANLLAWHHLLSTATHPLQDSMETIIMLRRWRWIRNVMRREQDNITRTSLHWTPEGKRKRRRLRNTECRTVEAELKTMQHIWGSIQSWPGTSRRGDPYATRHNGHEWARVSFIKSRITAKRIVDANAIQGNTTQSPGYKCTWFARAFMLASLMHVKFWSSYAGLFWLENVGPVWKAVFWKRLYVTVVSL